MKETPSSYLKTLPGPGMAILVLSLFLTGCATTKPAYHPSKKYSQEQLLKDYDIFRGALEESHPGLYWYSSPETMDEYFRLGREKINDSLNEEEFRKILSYVIARVSCGHTVVRSSRQFSRHIDSTRTKIFPLSLKIWDSLAVVAANLNRKDSVLKRGTVINKINHLPVPTILDTLFRFISSDGHNLTHKYQILSNRGGFGSAFTSVYGLRENYFVEYADSAGTEKNIVIPAYDTRTDSVSRATIARFANIPREERRKQLLLSARNMRFDSTRQVAIMDLGSFGRNLQLKSFFRKSFRTLRRNETSVLVIDVRGNGGGSVTNSTTLSKFISEKKFRVADSLYALTRSSRYKRYMENYFFNRLFMLLVTKKKSDGRYHFGYFERHYFRPKKKNHFGGTVYILTGGNSFSATTLFAQTVKDQENVILVGEETGGGAYGNTAWLIPDLTLPHTGVRFRLPLFRLVVNKNISKDGKGVQPEIEVKPTVDAIRRGVDYKMEAVMKLIRAGVDSKNN